MNPVAPLVLPPLSALYGLITKTRLSMYRRGTFRSSRVNRPVISVGNITTGGTGKTPLVEWTARKLADHGNKICVLTRGYGRNHPNERVLVSDGTAVFSTPDDAGDEAFLLATQVIGSAAVISDANRTAAAEDAIKHLRVDCFVLDDGFQHLRLARDLDIVVIDATNPFGGRRLLPEGRLREPLSGLARAGCIVITRVDQVNEDINAIQKELHRFTEAPVFTSRMQTRTILPLSNGPEIVAEPVGVFCGVGNPESFLTQVKREGYSPVFAKALRDHQRYSQQLLDSVCKEAAQAGARSLITTAKDAVKIRSLDPLIPIFQLAIEISIDDELALGDLILSVLRERH